MKKYDGVPEKVGETDIHTEEYKDEIIFLGKKCKRMPKGMNEPL